MSSKSARRLIAAVLLPLALGLTGAAKEDNLPKPGSGILFWTPAEQAVGYRRIEDVYKTSVIKRGKHVHPLPRSTAPVPDIRFRFAGVDYTTDTYMQAYRVSGILIIKDGKIVLERYGLGRSERDRWTSFSVAKSVTSTLAGAAIKDGFIKSIDDPVTRYIPELKGTSYEGVTVKHLLTMSSGVKWNEDYADAKSDVAAYSAEPIVAGKDPVVTYMGRLPREAPPGTKFLYKTGETDLAGILVARATHKSLAQYTSEKIWKPYGMERDALWMLDSIGHERGGCCMSITLRDYGRLGQFMLEGGKGVLPADWVGEATRKQIDTAPGGATGGYGYFWWMAPDGYDARGIFGQMIHVNPSQKLVIVTNSAWTRATGADLSAARVAFLNAATKAVQ
ncbi:serine hydrolase [soil metagenome]